MRIESFLWVAALVAGFILWPASASQALNACNAEGRYLISTDVAVGRVINSGCQNLGIRVRYQPPTSGGVLYSKRNVVDPIGGHTYFTSENPQATGFDGCSSLQSESHCTTWGPDSKSTSWVVFQ